MESAESQRGHKASGFALRDQAHVSIGDHYYNSASEITHPNRVILNWFSPLNFSARQKDIFSKIHQGTGKWFLHNERFQRWCKGAVKTLWCHGIPGAGKTFLSSIVIDHLRSIFHGDTIGIGCIFCDYNEQQDQTAEYLISSLLKQFVESQKDFPRDIPVEMSEMHQKHQKDQTQPSFDDLVGVFDKVVPKFSKVFIVVDALDECTENHDTRGKLIRGIRSLLSVDAHVMFTSRKVPQIERLCKGWPQVEISADDQDIRMYLEAHMEDEENDLAEIVQEDPKLRDQIIKKILEMSEGMFLLARLQLAVLYYQDNRAGVLRALGSLPRTLFDSYDVAWERIQKSPRSERAKQVLSWIFYASRPLRIEEVRDALAVSLNDRYLNPDARPAKGTLASACMGLVIIDQESEVIRLVHGTTRAYFKDKHHIHFPHAQQMIAETCLTYLLFDTFEEGYYYFDEKHGTEMHLLDYAARNWGYHASGDVEQAIQQLIFKFLKNDNKVSHYAQFTQLGQGILSDYQERYYWERYYRRDRSRYSRKGRSRYYREGLVIYDQEIPEVVTGMHISAYFGLRWSMANLLNSKVELDSKDKSGRTPLSWAAEIGQEAVAELLLKTDGVHLDSKDNFGRTPLSWAAERGQEAVVELLLKMDGVHLDSTDNDGQTPLSWAVKSGHEAVSRILLENGATIDMYIKQSHSFSEPGLIRTVCTSWKEQTALHLAVENGHEIIVNLLLERGADINKFSQYRSIKAGNGVSSPIYRGETTKSQTVLHLAIENGHEAVVNLLLKRGADINKVSQHKFHYLLGLGSHDQPWETIETPTPLHLAVSRGHKAVVLALLQKGYNLDINKRDNYGQTALHHAAYYEDASIAKLLLATASIDPDVKDSNGWTPLSLAAMQGREAVVKLLLTIDSINPDAKDSNGRTPLSWAARQRREAVVKLLLADSRVDRNSKDKLGRTPLSWAESMKTKEWGGKSDHESVIKLLTS